MIAIMLLKFAEIADPLLNIVATAEVEDRGNYYSGSVNLDRMPKALRLKFEEYESLINDQVLSLVDRIEEEMDINSFTVILDDGRKFYVNDLQILPGCGMVSFQLSKPLHNIPVENMAIADLS
jgi:hypothetical protein